MKDNHQSSQREGSDVLAELERLPRVPAPPSLLPTVLLRTGTADAYARVLTPIGPVFIACNRQGISALAREREPAQFEAEFRARFGRPVCRVEALPEPYAAALAGQLSTDVSDTAMFDLRGITDFERRVLMKALEIPRGEVRSYGWIAKEIGRPQAVRAVGTALKHNPIPLLIPCHRVVHSDGSIGEYLFGGDTKRIVLETEGAAPDVIERLGRSGVRFVANPDDGTFCLPTCGRSHLHDNFQGRGLRTERDAFAAGLRPCRDCRPAVMTS
jgi:methylated-DNA-[protein]-cysteine S-methyltransferase